MARTVIPVEADQNDDYNGTSQNDQSSDGETDDGDSDRHLFEPPETFFGDFSLARSVEEFRMVPFRQDRVKELIQPLQTNQLFIAHFEEEERPLPGDLTDSSSLLSSVGPRSFVTADIERELSRPLRRLYLRYLSTRQLLEAGNVIQAWTVLPTLVREAELLGLESHRDPDNAASGNRDAESRRRIWWLLMDLDSQLSFILGRRPVTVPFRDGVRPSLKGLQAEERSLRQNLQDFSSLALKILEYNTSKAHDAESSFEDRIEASKLHLKWLQEHKAKLPALQQEHLTDIPLWTAIADHQFEVQLLEVLLHCAMARTIFAEQGLDINEKANKGGRPRLPRKPSSKFTPRDLLQAVRQVTDIFDYIFDLDPAKATSSWPRCFGLYCASVILGISRLRRENEVEADIARVERVLTIFQDNATGSSRSTIAPLAISTLSEILAAIKDNETPRNGSNQVKDEPEFHDTSMKTVDSQKPTTLSNDFGDVTTPIENGGLSKAKRSNPSAFQDESRPEKRPRYSEVQAAPDTASHAHPHHWQSGPGQPYAHSMAEYSDMGSASFHDSSIPGSFDQHSFTTSAATSFNADVQNQYANAGYPPGQPSYSQGERVAPTHVGPPLVWYPPLYWGPDPGLDIGTMPIQWFQQKSDGFYNGPVPWPEQPARPVNESHGGHDAGMGNVGMHPLSQGDAVPMDVTGSFNSGAQTPTNPNQGPPQHEAQFYNTMAEPYAHADHPVSSPIMGDQSGHKDEAFGHTDGYMRRRSVADIRQQQNATWRTEAQSDYANGKFNGSQRVATDRPPTPPQETLLSPINEPGLQSRRNSATPRELAQANMAYAPIPTGQHFDQPSREPSQVSGHIMDGENVSMSRRQSVANIHNVPMGNIQPHGQSMTEPTRDKAEQQRGWNYSIPYAGPYPLQEPRLPRGPVMYDPNEYAMAIEQQFHHHLQPQHVVSTGPYAGAPGGQQWWPR
ncbi:hypothetical protein LTR10_017045 [Elasticomyces elasticus]|uniref:Transcription factor domain-containing protein n=1 Tax=Exophiala sideris TaxID=1016849 RepID=A0ABR0IZJ9_9EURO|nr:hypothetical protein LTR10_017045 [Elasticomyces elasticus]KAK5023053.1 hypothetical protein LTS07_009546 [Exophiala sideris]KAK5026778.1 hypothetical protein LTR13_009818 [Exophiala sideris]KAK5052431.1 hypothetical protein LTR69_009769 [Exophiala sideris]KAK5178216.1 hypothetical protein LTR44_009300 [Eurotiomycetes sp. CCFEE 6388]